MKGRRDGKETKQTDLLHPVLFLLYIYCVCVCECECMCVLLFYWQHVCIYCSSHPAVQQSVSTSLGSFVYQKQHIWLRFWAGSEMLHSHKHLLPQRLSVCTLQDARDRAVSSKRNLWWFMTYEMLFYNCSSKCFAGREKHHGKYKYALPLLIRWMLLFKVMVVMFFIPVLYMMLEVFFPSIYAFNHYLTFY